MLTEVDVDNRDGSLYPGMYAIVSFVQVRGVSPLVVPGDAVVVRQDRTSVAVVRDEKIQIVPVEIGRDYGPSGRRQQQFYDRPGRGLSGTGALDGGCGARSDCMKALLSLDRARGNLLEKNNVVFDEAILDRCAESRYCVQNERQR